jgi:RimJ/RimL family protein N-acetyltransferase
LFGMSMSADPDTIRIESWGKGDLPVLKMTLGDAEMTKHIGGPESDEKLIERQARFERLADSGTGRMFKIVDATTGEPVGSVGYWDRSWRENDVYEIGWFVITAFQGRGIAGIATDRAIAVARQEARHRFMHAFPSVENAPSNAICWKLGFRLLEECEFEYPPGNHMRCNDWMLDLSNAGE